MSRSAPLHPIARFALGAACLPWLAGCAAAATGDAGPTVHLTAQLKRLIDAARQEGALQLRFGTAGTTDEMNAWRAGFDRYYGLDLDITYTDDPVMPTVASDLIAERHAHHPASTDVYFGVAVFIDELERAGDLAGGALDGLPNVDGLAEDGGTAVALATTPTGITYNSDRVRGAQIPRSFAQLLTEPTSLRLASEPYAGTLAGLPRYWGTARTISYVTKLSLRLKGLFGCGEESRLVSGEFDIFAPDCGDNAARRLDAAGAPVAEVLPTDGSFITNTYLAVPVNAPHPAAARLWINYLMSRQAQDVLWQFDSMDSRLVAGSHIAPLIAADERRGVLFHPSDLATVRLDQPYQQAQTCIQAILNAQTSDPSCAPYHDLIVQAER